MLMIFPDDHFGRWIRKLRLQHCLAPELLAQAAQCDVDLLLQLEQGCLLELDALLCLRLLEALNVPQDTLFPPDEI